MAISSFENLQILDIYDINTINYIQLNKLSNNQ